MNLFGADAARAEGKRQDPHPSFPSADAPTDSGVEQRRARLAHNQEDAGSNPAPAISREAPGEGGTRVGSMDGNPEATRPSPAALPERHRAVWEVVCRHRGRENPIPVPAIAKITGIGERSIQTIKKELVEKYGCFVGTECRAATKDQPARHGYYLIVDDDDRALTSSNLWNRSISTIAQVQAIEGLTIEEVLHELYRRHKALNACTQVSENERGKSRLCACGCGESFEVTRPWHRYVNTEHQQRHHRAGRQLELDFLEGVA